MYKVITERDRGFAVARATAWIAAGWRVIEGQRRYRSGLAMKGSARRRIYWRIKLERGAESWQR